MTTIIKKGEQHALEAWRGAKIFVPVMKAIVVPILILLIATQTFSKWVLLLDFSLNRDYIAANLCENRTEPQTKCGGKCQLTKAMEKEETTPSSPAQSTKIKFAETLFPFELTAASAQNVAEKRSSPLPPYLLKRYSAPLPAIFHPPA
jgi:hypothetical protein